MMRIKAKKRISCFCDVTGVSLLILVMLLYLPITVPGFLGFQMYAVVSGSMEPAIPVGSLVYVEEADASALAPGDVVAYFSAVEPGTVVTHRVVENRADEGCLVTKGDANEDVDMLSVKYSQLIGRVRTSVPFYGFLAGFLGTFTGKLLAAGGILVAVFLMLLTRLKKSSTS